MLLFAKQWGRVAGCILAALVFLLTLRSLDILRPYPELLNLSPGDKDHAQDLPYRPQAETQEKTESDANGINIQAPAEAVTEIKGFPATVASETSSAKHNIYLEGIRKPEVDDSDATDKPTASETISPPVPSETAFRKAVVMGKTTAENTEWVGELKEWESVVYAVDLADNETSPTGFRTAMNKAKEVTPYLTYMVDHYDTFPDVAVFVHAHRNGWPAAWHNDAKKYDAVNMLNQLKMEAVLDRGYVNLRCITDPGCPHEIQLKRNPPIETHHAEIAYPYVYGDFFNMTVEDVREQIPVIATPCCAQFAVSREEFKKRPRTEYERFLNLVKESKYDDETLGTVMEYMWHLIFGRDAVHCENTRECWAAVYGRRGTWTNFRL